MTLWFGSAHHERMNLAQHSVLWARGRTMLTPVISTGHYRSGRKSVRYRVVVGNERRARMLQSFINFTASEVHVFGQLYDINIEKTICAQKGRSDIDLRDQAEREHIRPQWGVD